MADKLAVACFMPLSWRWKAPCDCTSSACHALLLLVCGGVCAAAFRVAALRKGGQIIAVATLRCVVGVGCMRYTASSNGCQHVIRRSGLLATPSCAAQAPAAPCTGTSITCHAPWQHTALQVDHRRLSCMCLVQAQLCTICAPPHAGCLETSWLRCPLWPHARASGGQGTAGGLSR